jgi:hypothetical protein
MAVEIKNHSDGTIAGVTDEHQLEVRSENHELQHHISWVDENVYQAIYNDTGITAASQTVLHVKNTSSTKRLVISFVRLLDMSSITTYAAGNYFTMGFNEVYASAGDVVTPVNTNVSSGKVAEATVYGDPTMADTGVFTQIDRVYTKAGDQVVYNKQGSIILGLNDTFSIKFVSTGTGVCFNGNGHRRCARYVYDA